MKETINSHFLLKVLCFMCACFFFLSCCFKFQGESVFFIPGVIKARFQFIMCFQIKTKPQSYCKCKHTQAHTAALHLQQFGGTGKRRAKGKNRKVSWLSITELSECYLCQTPTILSSVTETASRTSGRRGKHSRTPREV